MKNNTLLSCVSVAVFLGLLSLSPLSVADIVWRICTPINTATYTSRVHVKCSENRNGIRYFALKATNASAAARFLTVSNAALLSGKKLKVLYDTNDTSGQSFGCNRTDCRTARGISLIK